MTIGLVLPVDANALKLVDDPCTAGATGKLATGAWSGMIAISVGPPVIGMAVPVALVAVVTGITSL